MSGYDGAETAALVPRSRHLSAYASNVEGYHGHAARSRLKVSNQISTSSWRNLIALPSLTQGRIGWRRPWAWSNTQPVETCSHFATSVAFNNGVNRVLPFVQAPPSKSTCRVG